MKIKYSVDDLKRPISCFAEKPSMILVLLRHTPNPSSKFIDLDVEIPCARGTFVQFEPSLSHDGILKQIPCPNATLVCVCVSRRFEICTVHILCHSGLERSKIFRRNARKKFVCAFCAHALRQPMKLFNLLLPRAKNLFLPRIISCGNVGLLRPFPQRTTYFH